jgi:Zn finger protein HypA/HybF involved in hydrogenase expression
MLGNDVLSIEYEDWHCSCCGRRYKEYVLPYNFCPNCGAKMDVPDSDVVKMERSEE